MKQIKCPKCEELKSETEVYKRIDPYSNELFGDENENEMCNDCEGDSSDSI